MRAALVAGPTCLPSTSRRVVTHHSRNAAPGSCRHLGQARQSWRTDARPAALLPKAGKADRSKSTEPEEPMPMRALEDPSTSGRPPLPTADGTPLPPPERRGLLQRIAFSFVSMLSAMVPARLRAALSPALLVRLSRLCLFLAIGSAMSFAGHVSVQHRAATAPPQEVMYSTFLSLVESKEVKAARFEDGTNRIIFNLREDPEAAAAAGASAEAGATAAPRARIFYARHIPDPQLISQLMAAGVEFGAVKASFTSAIVRVIATALALWLPLIPLFILMRRFMEGRSGGGAKRRKGPKGMEVPPITFRDVAGVGAAKAELQEVVACLKDSRRYARVGAKLPSGVLLCGPPGTGKTLLAKAVAGEAGVPFMAVSASEFVELFVGRGAARIRELFAEARKRSPCVVFIDELDAVGGRRGAGLNEERDQTLNQLLTELDGFEGRPGVVLLAATNRPEVLDPALLRPGRLSRRVNVPLPDEGGRTSILRVHLRTVPVAAGDQGRSDLAALVARLTPGFSGAELSNVVNEAAFLVARRDGAAVELRDLVEAVSRTRDGVSGGSGVGTPLGRRLQGWLVDMASSRASPPTQPMGS